MCAVQTVAFFFWSTAVVTRDGWAGGRIRGQIVMLRNFACRWNREPLELARQAGLQLITFQRTFFGIFHVIEARPR